MLIISLYLLLISGTLYQLFLVVKYIVLKVAKLLLFKPSVSNIKKISTNEHSSRRYPTAGHLRNIWRSPKKRAVNRRFWKAVKRGQMLLHSDNGVAMNQQATDIESEDQREEKEDLDDFVIL